MAVGLTLQLNLMPRVLNADKARELVALVAGMHGTRSFRNILAQSAAEGVFKDNKTLRSYLDILVRGGVLTVRGRDVGSVYAQQLYSLRSAKPRVWMGLAVLRRHGLNWNVPEEEMRLVPTDFEGLARSQAFGPGLIGSFEDCLVHELRLDARRKKGTSPLVVSMFATKKMDLPYLLRRSDELSVGKAVRLAFTRILQVTCSKQTKVNASVFFAVRDRFLKIARQYSQSSFWKLVEKRGVGSIGLRIINDLGEYDIILTAGKQLGVAG